MSTGNLKTLEGELIPRSFNAGYVVLSYVVSYVGAWTTLEIINRRTAMRGLYNWLLLAAASLSMGGIAIWCMHFIGNRAITLGQDQMQLQIAYSTGFTALSFFMPVLVLFLAFWAVGSNESVSITRIVMGGTLAGLGVCGMHYLGQAGISNYDCVYTVAYVIGAGIIAVVASIGALMLFFAFRSSWDDSWWKRALCAVVLASAVSGMHWVATVGTAYRLRNADASLVDSFSRNSTVIVVIVLSVSGCFILLLFTLLAQRRLSVAAKRAQQFVVATAIFDHEGKILVTPEGLLPKRKITNTWLERSLDDVFSVSHPVFLWMFRTSRNWNGVSNLIPGMRSHIQRSGLKGRLGSRSDDAHLLNDQGTPIEDYSIVFRELFCAAAADLANDLNQPLDKIGILYDEIFPTGQELTSKTKILSKGKKSHVTESSSLADLEREGVGGSSGKGQLLFLVSRVTRREAENLQAAGYRFAIPLQVIPIMATTLQVKPNLLTHRFGILKEYATDPHMLDAGVHMACFAIRASLGAGRHGFDVLARKDARNQLPTMQLPIDNLEDWHLDYLQKLDSQSVAACIKNLYKASKPSNPSPKEQELAKHLLTTLEALKEEIEDPFFNDALLIAKPVRAPCRAHSEDAPPGIALLITFRIIVPIHSRAPGKKLVFTPLNFFKMQQHVYKNSPDHAAFARKTYREFSPVLDIRPTSIEDRISSSIGSNMMGSLSLSQKPSSQNLARNEVMMGEHIDMFGNPIPTLHPGSNPYRGPSKIRFWDRPARDQARIRGDNSSEKNLMDVHSQEHLGGIMVSQEVSVDVANSGGKEVGSPTDPGSPKKKLAPGIEMTELGQNRNGVMVTNASKEEEETQTYVDELFTICIAKRH